MQLTFPSALAPASPRTHLSLLPCLACLLIGLLVPTALRAETYTVPGTNITLTYDLSGNPVAATITDCNDNATGALVIPDTLGGAPVTSIGDGVFYSCSSLTSVTIPNNVTSIGDFAFYYCRSLTSVTIPNSVISIGNSAFYNCTSLTSITIPNSVTSIADGAFYDCGSLTSVTIASSVTSIGNYTFAGCTSLTSITIPTSVTSIGEWTFHNCSSLTSVTIPNSVISVGKSAFYNCTSLTSITIPNSVTSIGASAFRNCSSLTTIIVDPDNSTYSSVDGVLFNKAQSVLIQYPSVKIGTTYTIPNSVNSIGESAFYNCTSLTSVTIPISVTSIGSHAFFFSRKLSSVPIPNSVTSIGDGAFLFCSSLSSVTIPNSVTSIGESAFRNCSSLTSVSIPNSVTSIGPYAFSACFSLTAFIVETSNSAYSCLDGVLFNKVQSVLIQYPSAKTRSTYTIPNSVTSIGASAFDSSSLTSITIPSSVTAIGSSAFSNCNSIAAFIVDPASSAYSSLDRVLFNKAQSVLIQYPSAKTGSTYTIPNSATSLDSYAFYNCRSLTSVTIPNSVTAIGYDTFSYCRNLASITIPNSVTSISNGAFYECSSLTSVTFAGNAPATFGYEVFASTAPGFTIYYPPDASGFSTPTWKGYPAKPTLFYADTTYGVGGGWKWNGLGFLYDGFYPFLWLPQQQRWLYLVGSNEDSFFFFDFTRGYWGWTARAYYPQGVLLEGPENGVWVEL
ncbi:MAG: leucine-rich repeat domain-containing protein [Verrucomicrobiota bacterium]|nr:leucine-rich repeat domain-containing protein [Verrucomicrobiota bacterium]